MLSHFELFWGNVESLTQTHELAYGDFELVAKLMPQTPKY